MDEELLAAAQEMGYEHRRNGRVDRLERPNSPFTFNFEITPNNSVLPYFYVRTSSWDWAGERSDINDLLSTTFAMLLRGASTASCRFIEVGNSFSMIAGELYARYLVPVQPFANGYPIGNDSAGDDIRRLLGSAFMSEVFSVQLICPSGTYGDKGDSYSASDNALDEWASRIEGLLGRTDPEATYNLRTQPEWWYYRASSGTAIVRCEELALRLGLMDVLSSDAASILRDSQGVLIRDGGLRNYLPTSLERKAWSVLKGLEGPKTPRPAFVVLENQTVAIANSHCVFLPSRTGRKEFDRQIGRRRSQHIKNTEFLFTDTKFIWGEHVPGERFQSLVCDLLRREPGMSRVRSVGAPSERDDGRDYLVEWVTPALPNERADENEPPSRKRRVVVQCKSDKTAVSRRQVTGVYDTMRHYHAGYLLVVRSRLTAPLVDILDRIRAESIQFAEWWEGPDVEERLRANPDLLDHYSDIIRPAN